MSTTHFNCAYTFIFFILTYLYNNFNKPNDFFIPYSIYNIVSTPEYEFMYKTYTLVHRLIPHDSRSYFLCFFYITCALGCLYKSCFTVQSIFTRPSCRRESVTLSEHTRSSRFHALIHSVHIMPGTLSG